ncbi:MAG: guanylate kinase [Nitrospirota bacterium]|nr:guanylate kinase [Nitrospirota bacterium]
MKRGKGSLFIISAPSGAGKTTLCKKIVTTVDSLGQSVSFTTRKPRGGEVNDLDYTFIGEEEFREMIAGGDFVEWAEVHGNLYGTSRKRLEGLMDSGLDVILDIDTQGAKQIRRSYRDGVFIFILPPSIEILRRRLEKRRSNSEEDMARRLGTAVDEIREYNTYDYVIINDVLKDSVKLLEAIIIAERHKTERTDKSMIEKILA